jgi:hypothetical protein
MSTALVGWYEDIELIGSGPIRAVEGVGVGDAKPLMQWTGD